MRSKRTNKGKSRKYIYISGSVFIIVLLLLAFFLKSSLTKETSNKNTKNTDPESSIITSSKKKKIKRSSKALKVSNKNKIIESKFQSINLGNDGTTSQEAIKKFGDSYTKSNVTISGRKIPQLTWKNIKGLSTNGSIMVGFIENHAVNKGISGIVLNNGHKITQENIDSVKNGMKRNEVIKLFGKPNGSTESIIDNNKIEYLFYAKKNSNSAEPSFEVSLKNDIVTGKSK